MRTCRPLAEIALASSARELVRADMAKWSTLLGIGQGVDQRGELDTVAALLARDPAFRSLLFYRLGHGQSDRMQLMRPIMREIWKPLPSLRFHPDSIGPGCFILHGWETAVAARSIGSDFVVGPHVVIGSSAAGKVPTIGDRVTVYVGAIVIGDIRIGDDSTVGAGAVVVRDVPDGSTVVGVPARPVS